MRETGERIALFSVTHVYSELDLGRPQRGAGKKGEEESRWGRTSLQPEKTELLKSRTGRDGVVTTSEGLGVMQGPAS